MPPLETRLALNYQKNRWSAGGVLRLVDEQNRIDPGKGNIVGQDLGQTPDFAVLSLNAAYKPMAALTLSTGVDNLFDRSYAEHISRNGANITGYEATTRINEPGRTIWLKAQWQFN
jgi:iron complex outermembrane receptor protein